MVNRPKMRKEHGMSENEERKPPIGALWERESRAGKKRLTGNVSIDGQRVQVVAFQNNKQGNAKRPDWLVFLDTWDPDMNTDPATGRPLPTSKAEAPPRVESPAPVENSSMPDEGDDIPF